MQALFVPLVFFLINLVILYFVSITIGINITAQIKHSIFIALYLYSILAIMLIQMMRLFEQSEINRISVLFQFSYIIAIQPLIYLLLVQHVGFTYLIFGMICGLTAVYFLPAIIDCIDFLTFTDHEQQFHSKYYDTLYSKSKINSTQHYSNYRQLIDYDD